jgi:hypothetical protein
MELHDYISHYCQNNKVSSYLEIGSREGDSLKNVVKNNTNLKSIFCSDIWGSNWGGTGRGNHIHIENLLRHLNYQEQVTFLDGDSKVTIPTIRQSHENYFDLILVDGDHSYEGGMADLINVLPLCKSGGCILFHDITHPSHLYLESCFDTFVSNNQKDIKFSEKIKYSLGIGIIIKN